MFIAKVKTVSLTAAACLVVAGSGIVAAKQLTAPAVMPPSLSQPTVQFAGSSSQSNPAQTPGPVSGKPANTDPSATAAARVISVVVQARVVKSTEQQPAAYAVPENWVIDAVKALPVNRAAGHTPPEFVEVASPWQTLAWDKPTVIEVQYLRTTIYLSYGEQLSLSGEVGSGDARAQLPKMSLLNKAGATAVYQLTSTGYYLALQVVGTQPQRVMIPEPPAPAPAVSYTQGRIAKIEPGQLTLHVVRGPSGIMKNIATDDQTEVYLVDGQRGTLANLAVDQWIKVTLDAEGKRALRIKPGAPPWETTVPAEYTGAADLLKRWLAAIEANDLAAYQQCLHTEMRKVNEYGTTEALAFWTKQIKDLYKDGFKGKWQFVKPAEINERFPAGSVQAFPIVNGKPGREAILLLQESGQWVIVRLFS